MTPAGNRLLPVIAVAVVVVLAVVLLRPSGNNAVRSAPPAAKSADADTTADTLRTVAAQLQDMARRNDALIAENDRLRRAEEERATRVQRLAEQLERVRAGLDGAADSPELRTLREQLATLRSQAAQMVSGSPELLALQRRIGDLEQRIVQLANGPGAPPSGTPSGTTPPAGRLSTIVGSGPVGAGPAPGGYRPGAGTPDAGGGSGGLLDPGAALRALGIGEDRPGSALRPALGAGGKPLTGLVWYTALDAAGGMQAQPTEATFPWLDRNGRSPAAGAAAAGLPSRPAPVPVYTIPAWATLLDATAMTALVGRIPAQGALLDPYPFKIILSADALAANGHLIPGLSGMILAGTAAGDWALSCVRGTIFGATFVFEDGTIISYPQGNAVGPEAQGQPQGGGGQKALELGTITDEQGNPCVSGKRISNAPAYLTDRVAMIGAGAAAQAYADAQTSTTSTVGPFGATDSSQVTGNTGKYVLGATVRDAVGEVGKWLGERQKQSWDAVYVRPGAKVAVHVSREIWIDYLPDGRRLSHQPAGGRIHAHLD